MNNIPGISVVADKVPYYGKSELKVTDNDQTTPKIIAYMLWGHEKHRNDYDAIAEKFWQGNAKDTAALLFDFHKKYITYRVEPVTRQTIKSPGRYVADKHGDCKHYSLFSCGVADALARKGYPIRTLYRFVADDPGMEVHHVFAVITDPAGNEVWVDPVLKSLDQRPDFAIMTDKRPKSGVGAIYYLSGTNNFQNVAMVGKYDDDPAIGNVFKKFAKAMETNFANLKKDVKHVANEAKEVVNKVTHGQQVNLANLKKDVKHVTNEAKDVIKKVTHGQQVNLANLKKEVKKQAHALDVNFSNAKNAVIKVGGVPARKAFLGLIALNVHNMAQSLNAARQDPERAKELKRKWTVDAQGDWQTLMNTIDRGLKKKAFLGVEPISMATIATWLTLASAIIALLGPLLKLKPHQQAALNNAATAGAAGILASTYTGATMMDANANNPAAAAAALNALANNNNTTGGMSMDVIPGVTADGSPMVAVNDISGTMPDGTIMPGGGSGGGGGMVENLINQGKQFVSRNRGIIITVGAGIAIGGAVSAANKKNKNKGGAIMAIAAGLGIAGAAASQTPQE